MHLPRPVLALAAAGALAVPAAAHAATIHHTGNHKVCAKSTLIERAPGDHPIGVAYKGHPFYVTSTKTKTTHPSEGSAVRWIRGYRASTRNGHVFRIYGWVRTADLC